MKQTIILALLLLFVCPVAFAAEIGKPAPEFTLTATDGKTVSLADYKDKVVVLEWFNKGCPFVVKHYDKGAMQQLQADAVAKDVVWLTINSTNASHKDYLDADATKETIKEWKIEKALMLTDADGKVGKLYSAKTTPHMYVINKGTLVYQGAIDDDPDAFGDPTKAKNHVKAALDEVLAGKEVTQKESKPYGCSVKY